MQNENKNISIPQEYFQLGRSLGARVPTGVATSRPRGIEDLPEDLQKKAFGKRQA